MRHKPVEDSVDARIAAIAGRQGGVISTRQLMAAGLDRSAIARRVRRGWLHPIHQGVYAVGHTSLTSTGRWFAAVLACGDRAVLSHRPAAAAWDLRPVPSGPVDVTVPPGGRELRSGLRMHRSALEDSEKTSIDGLPITTPERTLLDIATILRPDHLERAVEQAEWRRLVDREELQRLAETGWPGAPALRAALTEPFIVTRSVLERRFLKLCRDHGLPKPLVNVVVCGYEVDFFWPEHRLVVETDGGQYHRTRKAFEDDKQRDVELLAAGFRTARFTHRRITYEPGWVGKRLKRLLDGFVSPGDTNPSST